MKRSTKNALWALTGLAGIAALAALALYEEDQDQTVSRLGGQLADRAQEGLSSARESARKGWEQTRSQADRAGDFIADHWQDLHDWFADWIEDRMA